MKEWGETHKPAKETKKEKSRREDEIQEKIKSSKLRRHRLLKRENDQQEQVR